MTAAQATALPGTCCPSLVRKSAASCSTEVAHEERCARTVTWTFSNSLRRVRVLRTSVVFINVTVYTVAHLTDMAMRGSLFVRHLIDEGIVLSDPHNLVSNALEAYRVGDFVRPTQDGAPPDSSKPWRDLMQRKTVRSWTTSFALPFALPYT